MPIYREDALKYIESLSEEIEGDLISYLYKIGDLVLEDDWSFVIKTHAFIEMVISEHLQKKIGNEELLSFIQRLPLSDGTKGKLALIKSLNLLDKPQRKFIQTYSELRNNIVHKFENVNFSFNEYFASLDKNQIKKWKQDIVWFPAKEEFQQLALSAPKIVLWFSIFHLISSSYLKSAHTKLAKDINEMDFETSEKILSKQLRKILKKIDLSESTK